MHRFSLILVLSFAWGCESESTNSPPTATAEAAQPDVTSLQSSEPTGKAPEGMVWIPGRQFTMGSEDDISRLNERPKHQVEVDGFWMDVTPVTNAQFGAFVDATDYQTTAEVKPDWEELKKTLPPNTPKPDDSLLVAGSMVFTPSEGPVDLRIMANFWTWTPGADWRHPEGPDSDLKGRDNHPVVHISWDDANAYCEWARKRLPTEAEWEFAARGGRNDSTYFWGDEFQVNGKFMANTWTGDFPYRNTNADGFERTAPVKTFPANGYELFGMAGNVWNWCSDRYRPDTYASRADQEFCSNPTGPGRDLPGSPVAMQRVVKGGSFLCHPDYCASYRPSARRGLPSDTGMSHVSFRCVKSTAAR